MSKQFPKFSTHAAAVCFCCGEALSDAGQDSGNAHGCGQFFGICTKTRMRTWYDIPNGHAHPIFQKVMSNFYRPTVDDLERSEIQADRLAMFRAEY